MNINFTNESRAQLEMIAAAQSVENGFILGRRLGKQIIIQHLFPIPFSKDTLHQVYDTILEKQGDRLIGVFFNHCEPFLDDWLLEDIILKIEGEAHAPHPRCLVYDYQKNEVRPPVSVTDA